MTDCEEGDIDRDIFELVEEEDDAEQEEQVVVPGHHVLRAEVHERDRHHSRRFLDVSLVSGCDTVGESLRRENHQDYDDRQTSIGQYKCAESHI